VAHPRVLTLFIFGMMAGLPLLLIFSTLSLWLGEVGISKAEITYFSWAALGYSFKFVWAPLVDVLPLPILTKQLGRRRAWLFTAQLMVGCSIVFMAMVDPATQSLALMGAAAVCLGFSSATQDIVIDAYRIESAEPELQAMMSASYIAGYRIGMLIAGGGALFLAEYLGTTADLYHYDAWQMTYIAMAGLMLIGIITTLIIKEPVVGENKNTSSPLSHQQHIRFFFTFLFAVVGFIGFFVISNPLVVESKKVLTIVLNNLYLASFFVESIRLGIAGLFAAMIAFSLSGIGFVQKDPVKHSYIDPVQDFFSRYGWSLAWLLLALVGLYRISDIVLGVIANPLYQDLGFTKSEIGSVVKTFGVFMTIFGAFMGGVMALRFGVMPILMLGVVLSAATNLLFMVLAQAGHDVPMLFMVIAADNLSGGLANAAFIAFLSSLTNISFTAVQYAIFSSLMTLIPKIIGGYSGSMVEVMGFENFFLMTALMSIPVIMLIILAGRRFNLKANEPD
jgi:PAT family beta-lactamase induction signal transducer AmpG